MCGLALELPLKQDSARGEDKGCVAATLGHGIASVTWVPPINADIVSRPEGGSGGSSQATLPAILQFEMVASSAGVRVNPEGFDLLENVHARVKGVMPLESLLGQQAGRDIAGSDQPRGGRQGDATTNYCSTTSRDELLEKLREKYRPDDAELAALLPARPVLALDEVVGDNNAGIAVPCAQLALTSSPVRLNLAESHILGLACLAMEFPTRVGKLMALFAPPPPPTLPRGDSDSATSEAPVAGSVVEQERQRRFRSDGTVLSGSVVEGSAPVTIESSPTAALTSAGAAERGSSSAGSSPPVRTVEQEQEQKRSARDGVNVVEVLLPPGGRARSRQAQQERHESLSHNSPDAAAFLSIEKAEEAKVGTDGPTNAAPVPPPFWGTLIVQAVSVMVWEDQPRRGDREPLRSSAPASATAAAHVHSPLLYLDIQGIGVGVDLAPRSAIASSGRQVPPSLPRPEEDGAARNAVAARNRRVEVAVKRISVMDVSRTRRPGSLVRLLDAGMGDDRGHFSEPAATAGSHQDGRGEEPVNSNADNAGREDGMGRILRAGWWKFGAIDEGDSVVDDARSGSGYDEQFLLWASLCPVSNEVCIEAALTSGQFVVLPAPILDVLNLASDLERDIAQHARSVRTDAMSAPLSVVESSSRTTARGTDGDATPNLRHGDGDHADEHAKESWRQVVGALGGSALSDAFPWLQRVHLEISANSLQLWLPDIARASTAAAHDAEAIVASCSCQMSLSLAASLLHDSGTGMDPALDSAVAAGTGTSEVGQDSQGREEAKEGTGSRGGDRDLIAISGGAGDDSVAAPDAPPSASRDCSEDLCVMRFGLHDVELFVARPSMAEFRKPIVAEPDAQAVALVVPVIDSHSRARGVNALPSDISAADSTLGDLAECDASAGKPGQAGVDDGGGSRCRSLDQSQRVVLPFSFDLSHVLSVSRCPPAWSLSSSPSVTPSLLSSPLQSQVDVTVTEIRARWFIDFPLAARVLAASIMPLVMQDGAPPVAPLEAANDRRSDDRFDGEDGRQVGDRGVGDHVMTAEVAPGRTSVVDWSKLAAMWTCCARLEAEGLRMTVVNNLYHRQNMPALDAIVSHLSDPYVRRVLW